MAALAAYAGLAVLQTWPLVMHLDTHLPGQGLGDNVSFVWNLQWMRDALASPGASFFFTPALFAPIGTPLILHTHTAAPAWIAATLLSPLSVVTAQNVLVMASLVLNGWSVWWLARSLTRDAAASFVAGALFLLSPIVAGRLMGHFNLVAVWPFVLACWMWLAWWRTPAVWRGIVLGVAAGLLPFFDYYLAVYFLVFALVSIVVASVTIDVQRTARRGRGWSPALAGIAVAALALAGAITMGGADAVTVAGARISARSPTNALTVAWLSGLAAWMVRWRWSIRARTRSTEWHLRFTRIWLPLLVSLVVVSPLIGPTWHLWSTGGYVTQQSGLRSGPSGADLATVVMGPPFHGVARGLIRAAHQRFDIDSMESAAYVGWTATLLVAFTWRRFRNDGPVRHWRVALVVFAAWALGPYLMVLGYNTGLILPAALLRIVPLVNNARIPGRALIVVAMCLAILCAYAIGTVERRRRLAVCGLVVVAAVIESLAAPLPLAAVPIEGVYARIASDPSTAVVLPIPFGVRDGFGERGRVEADAILQQTRHHHPIAGGFVARLPPNVPAWYDAHEPFASLIHLSDGDDDAGTVSCSTARDGLTMAGVAFVVLYADAPEPLRRYTASLPLERVDDDGLRTLYTVGKCPS